MNRNIITQGTIIYPIKSDKYQDIRCYGIVISARCDIAQGKISKIYLLIGVDAKEWMLTDHGIAVAYKSSISGLRNSLNEQLKPYMISFEVIESMGRENVEKVFEARIPNETKRKKIKDSYDNLFSIQKGDREKRKKYVKNNVKPAVDFLNKISAGTMSHYFFIPQNAYLQNKVLSEGIIADLQEIMSIPITDLERIYSPGIDVLSLDKLDEYDRRKEKEKYYLEEESDYVAVEGTIKSPWCELLMQRFSNDFIRIGVDNATEENYKALVLTI